MAKPKPILNPEFATNVKRYRIAQGLSQVELGKRLGSNQSRVRDMEGGRVPDNKRLVGLLAYTLKVDPADLVPGIQMPASTYCMDDFRQEEEAEDLSFWIMRMLEGIDFPPGAPTSKQFFIEMAEVLAKNRQRAKDQLKNERVQKKGSRSKAS